MDLFASLLLVVNTEQARLISSLGPEECFVLTDIQF